MKQNILWKVIPISLTIFLAFIFFLPNTPLFMYMPEWWQKNMPSKGIVLGLDLRGGLHLVYEVEGDKAVVITTERYVFTIKDILAKRNLTADVIKSGSDIVVSPSTPEIRKAMEDNNQDRAPTVLRLLAFPILGYKVLLQAIGS